MRVDVCGTRGCGFLAVRSGIRILARGRGGGGVLYRSGARWEEPRAA